MYFFLYLSSISEMALPQTNCNKFSFSSYFGNVIATNSLPHFPALNFGNGIATNQLEQIFFPSYFGNAIDTISFHKFFFFWEMICAHNFYNIFTINLFFFFLRIENGGLSGYITPSGRAPVGGRQPGPISALVASTIVWGVNPTKDAHQRTLASNGTWT